MGFDGPGWGFGMFGEALSRILYGIFSLVALLVLVALIFLLVRFLLVATKAAQLYVAEHRGRGQQQQPVTAPTAEDTATTRPLPPTEPKARQARPKNPPAQ